MSLYPAFRGPHRALDVTTRQDPTLLRYLDLRAEFAYSPTDRATVAAGPELAIIGATAFHGNVGAAGNLVFGALFGSKRVEMLYVRVEVGVDLAVGGNDWTVDRGTFGPCARQARHRIVSLLPGVQYTTRPAGDPGAGGWSVRFASGYRAFFDSCSSGGD